MIDEVDYKIMKTLYVNGRATLRELAEVIGYTSMGAKKRLDRLINNEIISIRALVNAEKLSVIPVIIFIEAVSGDVIRKIISKFKDCPRLVNFFTTIGRYNLIALMIAEDIKTLESISTEKCSIRRINGVKRIEYYPVGEVHYTPYLSIRVNLAGRKLGRAPCGVNCAPCPRYKSDKCLGCPATKYYKGSKLFKMA